VPTKAAVIPLVREQWRRGGVAGAQRLQRCRMYEWSDERDRKYTVYLAETPVGELLCGRKANKVVGLH
jgi:hypothetical protein